MIIATTVEETDPFLSGLSGSHGEKYEDSLQRYFVV
jgi:hypothetical protein